MFSYRVHKYGVESTNVFLAFAEKFNVRVITHTLYFSAIKTIKHKKVSVWLGLLMFEIWEERNIKLRKSWIFHEVLNYSLLWWWWIRSHWLLSDSVSISRSSLRAGYSAHYWASLLLTIIYAPNSLLVLMSSIRGQCERTLKLSQEKIPPLVIWTHFSKQLFEKWWLTCVRKVSMKFDRIPHFPSSLEWPQHAILCVKASTNPQFLNSIVITFMEK